MWVLWIRSSQERTFYVVVFQLSNAQSISQQLPPTTEPSILYHNEPGVSAFMHKLGLHKKNRGLVRWLKKLKGEREKKSESEAASRIHHTDYVLSVQLFN